MTENPQKSTTFSRPACFEDFFGDHINTKNDKNYKNDKNSIVKNQQEFGNRKRIKP